MGSEVELTDHRFAGAHAGRADGALRRQVATVAQPTPGPHGVGWGGGTGFENVWWRQVAALAQSAEDRVAPDFGNLLFLGFSVLKNLCFSNCVSDTI